MPGLPGKWRGKTFFFVFSAESLVFTNILPTFAPQFGNEWQTSTDVPWCNGSTRVFGSLSHRSNRCGTTSPSPPSPAHFFPALAQDSFFLAVSFLDTAFLVFFRPFLPPRTLRCGAGCHFYQIFMPGSLQTAVLMSNFAGIQEQTF